MSAPTTENLVLAQVLKQADKGRPFSTKELQNIFRVYGVKWENVSSLVKKLQEKGILETPNPSKGE